MRQQSLILHLPFFPEDPGHGKHHFCFFLERRGTKQPAPPHTKFLAVLWLPATHWVPASLVVLAQEHALAHSVTYTRLLRVG